MKINSEYITIPIMRGFQEIEVLFELCEKHNCMILGGYVRYMGAQRFNPPNATDVDVFPQADYCQTNILTDLKNSGFTIEHENELSVTLKKPDPCPYWWAACPRVQIIKPVTQGAVVTVGVMADVLDNFDFTIVRVGLVSKSLILADKDFVEHEQKRKIIIKNIHCPISSTLRIIKYSKKGYWCGPLEISNLFMDWDERSAEYKTRLLELIGNMKVEGEPSQEEIDELEKLMNID